MQRINQFFVLLATSDSGMAGVLKTFLEKDCFSVYKTATGDETRKLLATWKPELIILDSKLPDLSGWELFRQIKAKIDVPIIIVGDRGKENEHAKALAAGADGYLTKPFSFKDIAECAKSILWQGNNELKLSGVLQAGGLKIDLDNLQVSYKGREITLTMTEFRILEMLILHSEKTLNRGDIIKMIWGKNLQGTTRTIDAHIYSLRRKLAETIGGHGAIKTVHGVGYRFAMAKVV